MDNEQNALKAYLQNSRAMEALIQNYTKAGSKLCAFGVPEQAKSAFLRALHAKTAKQVVYIAPKSQLTRADFPVYPTEELQLRNIAAKTREPEHTRIEILLKNYDVVGIPAEALARRLMTKKDFVSRVLTLKKEQDVVFAQLFKTLGELGYERVDVVYAKGQFAKRGEVLDIFSPGYERPFRLGFFDTQIESIKTFDTDSQQSAAYQKDAVRVLPATEYILNEQAKTKAIAYFRRYAGEDSYIGTAAGEHAFSLQEFGTFQNIDSFMHTLADTQTVCAYFPNAVFVTDSMTGIRAALKTQNEAFLAEYDKLYRAGEAFFAQKEALLSPQEAQALLPQRLIDLNPVADGDAVDFALRTPVTYGGNFTQLAKNLAERRRQGWDVRLCVGGKAESLSRALGEFDLIAPVVETPQAGLCCLKQWMKNGCECAPDKVLFLGEADIYHKVKKETAAGKKTKERKKSDDELFAELKAGDFVVHEVHGRGRYLGLITMEAAGSVGEYLEIEYKGGDKLYVPTAQIGRVQKYIGGEDGQPMLSKLGGKEWDAVKQKARESVKKLAFDLVELYAHRFEQKGFAFSPDTVWQRQFEDDFEFEETEGQKQSIAEIKHDMESPKVMDRLLLGDVGYGKTEVAMRAAMKAVMDSKQVCMLVPTTLLARQHGETFQKRFEGFPVRIAVLSRYSGKQEKEILQSVKNGQTDIVIGTHKLLSDAVQFADLGLLIVDEEQRFGVAHKEKIKRLKETVDVLTLSATPIPRTLEMSLIGVRDLSTIKTPPQERKQTLSYVMKYSDSLVRDAISRELARGGQVYFVVRQIGQIERMLQSLRLLVPEARIAFAHGQMTSAAMERVITDFVDHKIDVLLCTTIIESGIDIPSVNTVIIYEADKFGLSQLYQLRGRVGRGDQTACAYFTFLSDYMGENAKKRLAAIREFTTLGSGFKIAMRDLQIRGAGNLLGPEQSGHMMAVGYTLYCKMMREAIDRARGKAVEEEEIDTTVDLGVPALIPPNYIQEENFKLDMYKQIARIGNLKEARQTLKELSDRYGEPPKEVNNLIACAVVRKAASKAGIASVLKKGAVVELKYDESVNFDLERLMRFLEENKKIASLRATTPPAVLLKVTDVKSLIEFLNALKHCKTARQVV